MSSTPAAAVPSTGQPKVRNPLERLISWGVIVAMLAVAGIEYRAKQGFAKTLTALENAHEAGKGLTLTNMREMVQLSPTVTGPEDKGGFDHYTFRWFSLFKSNTYRLSVKTTRGDDAVIVAYFAPDPMGGNDLGANMPGVSSGEPSAAAPEMTGGPYGGGGGGGAGGPGGGFGGPGGGGPGGFGGPGGGGPPANPEERRSRRPATEEPTTEEPQAAPASTEP